jgi:glutamine amidotransferase
MAGIVIVDYGMGNLHSVNKAFQFINVPAKISSKVSDIKNASGIVLPGVGAFGDAMDEIKKRGLFEILKAEAKKGKPFLGICLGMQLLMSSSTEFGVHRGFDFIKGKVTVFKGKMKIPHMGWNDIKILDKKEPILKGIKDKTPVYFVHSFYTVPVDKKDMLTKTTYGGIEFASAVHKDNVYGFQFHPEKSGEPMLRIYSNFYGITKK